MTSACLRIQAVVFEGMTLLDLVGPMQAWSLLPGAMMQYVGKIAGPVTSDCGLIVTATHDFSTAWPDPDVLFIGGAGRATLTMVADPAVAAFLKSRGEQARWITSVCTGSLILGAAGLLQGYRAATHWAAREQLTQFGATVSDERMCIDRNRMTGGGITSGIDFGIALAGKWAGDDVARMIELMMEYAPQPPFGTGRPELADPATLAAARQAAAAEFS